MARRGSNDAGCLVNVVVIFVVDDTVGRVHVVAVAFVVVGAGMLTCGVKDDATALVRSFIASTVEGRMVDDDDDDDDDDTVGFRCDNDTRFLLVRALADEDTSFGWVRAKTLLSGCWSLVSIARSLRSRCTVAGSSRRGSMKRRQDKSGSAGAGGAGAGGAGDTCCCDCGAGDTCCCFVAPPPTVTPDQRRDAVRGPVANECCRVAAGVVVAHAEINCCFILFFSSSREQNINND